MNTASKNSESVIAGCKDGKIKVFNVNTGEQEKVLNANLGPVVECLVVETENNNGGGGGGGSSKNDMLILSCSNKDNYVLATNVRTGSNE